MIWIAQAKWRMLVSHKTLAFRAISLILLLLVAPGMVRGSDPKVRSALDQPTIGRLQLRSEALLGGFCERFSVPGGVSWVGIVGNGQLVVAKTKDGDLRFWRSAALYREYPASCHVPYSVAVSMDGKSFAEVHEDRVTIRSINTGRIDARLSLPEPWLRPVAFSVAFSPDSRRLAASVASRQASDEVKWNILIWDLPSRKVISRFQIPRFSEAYLAFSPSGRMLVSGDFGGPLYLWDAESGKALVTLQGFNGQVGQPAFSHDSRTLAAVGEDGRIHVWETATGKERLRIGAGAEFSGPVAFSSDGYQLAAVSQLSKIKVWDLAAANVISTFEGQRNRVTCLAFFPDGMSLASGGEGEAVTVWRLPMKSKSTTPIIWFSQQNLETLWRDLATNDAVHAYRAIRRLQSSGEQAVEMLAKQLEGGPDQREIIKLTSQLDSNNFEAREAARKKLESFGKFSRSALEELLAGKPSLEARQSAQRLITSMDMKPVDLGILRIIRAVEVLENCQTVKAIGVLKKLSSERYPAQLRTHAEEALNRIYQGGK